VAVAFTITESEALSRDTEAEDKCFPLSSWTDPVILDDWAQRDRDTNRQREKVKILLINFMAMVNDTKA